jgi:pimeloyl-ACP methyl ester carboxylesterase
VEAAAAQREAINKYCAPAESVLDYLKDIRQPTLVVNGSTDVMVPTVNSYIDRLPNLQVHSFVSRAAGKRVVSRKVLYVAPTLLCW